MGHHHSPHIQAKHHDRGERGASLVEYAMLMALISVVVFSAVSFFGSSAGAGFGHSKTCIAAAYDGTLGNSCPATSTP